MHNYSANLFFYFFIAQCAHVYDDVFYDDLSPFAFLFRLLLTAHDLSIFTRFTLFFILALLQFVDESSLLLILLPL